MAYYDSSGILLIRPGHLEVYFCKSRCYRDAYSREFTEECQKVFALHGFMESVLLPYKVVAEGLIVRSPCKEALSAGWQVAEDVDSEDIPF